MPTPPVLLDAPFIAGKEQEYVAAAIAKGQTGALGEFTARCEAILAAELDAPRVLLTTSSAHALEITAFLLGIAPGDEVIMSTLAPPSSANAFAVRGARLRFTDVRADTLNLDEAALDGMVGDATKAILPLHYAGVGCAMIEILTIAARRGVAVVEDNRHGLLASHDDSRLGSLGALAALSFEAGSNLHCGVGGALVINEAGFIARAEVLRDGGTNRAQLLRNEVDHTEWVALGSSYAPAEILAAFLSAQLEERAAIQHKRQRIWNRYSLELGEWAYAAGARLPEVPDESEAAHALFYLLLSSARDRERLIAHLAKRRVEASGHYAPLHLTEMGRRAGGDAGDCPVAEELSQRLLRLPFHAGMTAATQTRVIDALLTFES